MESYPVAVLLAICCAADISAEAKAHFFRINNEEYSGPPFEGFIFVDSLNLKHIASDLEGDQFEASSPDSPFKGKNVTECSALLKQITEQTGVCILDTVFAIYDDRSTQDQSLLLVQKVDDDEFETMRVVPELACTKLQQYVVYDAVITEDREEAEEEEDGVFRINQESLE